MSATDLRFSQRQPVTTDLRFGLAPGAPGSYNAATIAASVTVGATAVLSAKTGYLATLAAAVDVGFEANLHALYDNSVNRAPHLWEKAAWEVATPAPADTAAAHRVSAKAEAQIINPLHSAQPLAAAPAIAWRDTDRRHRPEDKIPFAAGLRRAADARDAWRDLLRQPRPEVIASSGNATPRPEWLTDGWQERRRRPRPPLVIPWGEGRHLQSILVADFGVGKPLPLYIRVPWQEARRPPPGISVPGTVTPPAHVPCYTPNTALRFWELASTTDLDLRFRCPYVDGGPGETIVIPIRRIYMQTNTVAVVVADTGQPIVTRNLRLSLDADSWVWGWSAVVSADHLAVLSPSGGGQVELLATLNGTAFRLAVERIRRDRTFGKAALAISGRGRAAWLADPYADIVTRTNTEARTAQQLMADALTENGVSIGWSLDWQITDWLVPAGAWSHTGTAMEACLTIAAAAGAYIQAHRTNQELRILPRYPSVPWSWGSVTPDIQIPEDVCVTEGIEWIDKPAYNTVFISGQEGGILAHVTRAGTAGDKPAPMITDPLVAHADAGRQRGTAILSDTGRQKLISLSLPVLPETGIIVPGKFVRYTEGGTQHIGLTRAVEVGPEFPKLRQTITVESHVL